MKALVIQLARMGDILQTARLVATLKQTGAAVHFACETGLAAFVRDFYPNVRVHGLRAHGGAADAAVVLSANAEAFAALAAEDFDAVYNCNFAGMNFALANLFPEARVHGYFTHAGQRLKDPWPTLAFRLAGRRAAAPVNLVDLWAHFARPVPPAPPNSPAPRPRGGGLGVVLAGRHARRSLPPGQLALLAAATLDGLDAFAGDRARPVYLLGTDQEKPLARQFFRHASRRLAARTVDLAGATDLPGLTRTLQSLDLTLTPDTGSMHLAASMGVPVLAVFLASAWAWETGPCGEGHLVWQSVAPCAPCLEAAACPHGVACAAPFNERGLLKGAREAVTAMLHALTTADHDAPAAFPSTAPEGVALLRGETDALGQTYAVLAGTDPHAETRRQGRRLLAEWAGASPSTESASAAFHATPMHEDVVRALYRDADWMLPPWRERGGAPHDLASGGAA